MKVEAEHLLTEFREALSVDWQPSEPLMRAARDAVAGCGGSTVYGKAERKQRLLALVNGKLGVNERRLQSFLNGAAAKRVFFNYHEKAEILAYLNCSDVGGFASWAVGRTLASDILQLFDPAKAFET